MIRILVTGVGGPTPRSIARTLHRFGKQEYELIGTDINKYAYGLYEKNLYSKTYIIPPADHPSYWSSIKEIIEKNGISLAIVQPELEVLAWSKYKDQGKPWPCKVLLPDYDIVKTLVDKASMTDLLKESDLVPKSLTINPKSINFNRLEKELPYPFWIRATSGSSGLGSLKVVSNESLQNWLTINQNVKQFIGSTFLPGRNLACKLLYKNGKLVRAASGERVNYIMSKVAPSGITGNTSFGRLLNEPDLIAKSKRALEIISNKTGKPLHGFFTADFKEDADGRPFITEINVRMVAFNLSFAVGGANFTEDIVDILTENPQFDENYQMYTFEEDLIFLRDVDSEPILMKEKDLLQ